MTVVPDNQPPRLVHATAVAGTNQVWLAFSEPMDAVKADDLARYQLNGAVPRKVTLSPGGEVVMLEFADPVRPGALVSLRELRDQNGNPMAPITDAVVEFIPWVGQAIRAPKAPVSRNRSYFPVGPDGLDLLVEGGHCHPPARSDDLLFACQEVEGDFDFSARVMRLDPTACFASAGLMVRRSLRADSDYIFPHATPVEGNSWTSCIVADTRDGNRVLRPLPHVPATWVSPVSIPDEWLRIRRSSNEFTIFRSRDGKQWQPLWVVPFEADGPVFVGLTAHSESRPRTGFAAFREIQFRRPANGRRWAAQDLAR